MGQLEINGVSFKPKEFMKQLINIDKMSDDNVKTFYEVQKGDFSAKLRNKLRHLRTIKSILNSQEKNDLFSKFLMFIYFRSAKMNINNEDLVGPFLKVSS